MPHGRSPSRIFPLLFSRLFCTQRGTQPAAELGDLLLEASLSTTLLLRPTSCPQKALHAAASSPAVLLRLLRRPSLPPASRLDLLRLSPAPSPAAFSALLHSLSLRPSAHAHLLPALRFAFESLGPSAVDPSTLKLLLDALLSSARFDDALHALDLLPAAAAPSLLTPRVYGSVILALLKNSHLGPALSLFKKLLDSPSLPDTPTCNRLLLALWKSGMRDEFQNLFDELSNKKSPFNTTSYNICIHAFGSWGHLGFALCLFKEMKATGSAVAPDLCTYNTVLRALCLGGKLVDALAVYEEMKGSGHEPDRFTYRTLIHGCCKAYCVNEALRVFREMEYNNVRADTVVYNSLLDGLLKVRKLDDACQLFEKMVADGVRASCYSYNILIDGLFRNGRPIAGFTLFCDLKKKGKFVDAITYSIVIMHLCRERQVERGLDLVKEMEERGFVVDLVTITSLLIGLHKNGKWDSADQLMKYVQDNSLLPSVLRWKENVKASLRSPQDRGKDFAPMFPSVGNLGDIMSWINPQNGKDREEPNFDSEPKDEWSSSPYLDHLADKFELMDDSQPFTMSRGQRVRENGIESFDIDMVNTYLSIFLAKGKLSIACKLFEIFTSLGREPVTYTYNALMSAFVKKGYLNEAWGVLQEMGDNVCLADIATYNVIIQGLGKMGKADLASTVLDQLLKNGGYLDVVMYNTLINALGKARRIDEANKLFKQMTESGINPDVVTFNTLIEVHAKAGKVREANKFLKKMLAAGISPNHVTDTTLDFLEKEIEKLRYQKASMMRCDKELATDPL